MRRADTRITELMTRLRAAIVSETEALRWVPTVDGAAINVTVRHKLAIVDRNSTIETRGSE